jgi:hypothetical protein
LDVGAETQFGPWVSDFNDFKGENTRKTRLTIDDRVFVILSNAKAFSLFRGTPHSQRVESVDHWTLQNTEKNKEERLVDHLRSPVRPIAFERRKTRKHCRFFLLWTFSRVLWLCERRVCFLVAPKVLAKLEKSYGVQSENAPLFSRG